ncbi:MAG: hypothetical protein H7Z12_15345 [Rhodospirillaceae bacterium]|nr:hypothetical protein [Rhodospirillales bacterium]
MKFVTLGSPLGIRAIARTLAVPLENLGQKHGWFNGFAPHDVVALNPLDAKYFSMQPAIRNLGAIDDTTSNHHGIISHQDKASVCSEIVSGFD